MAGTIDRTTAPDAILWVWIPLRPRVVTEVDPSHHRVGGQGLLFDLLRTAAPDLGDRLHAPSSGRQPYAVSPLLEGPLGPEARALRLDQTYGVRLGLIGGELVETWRRVLWPALVRRSYLHIGPPPARHNPAARCAWDFVLAPGPDDPPPRLTSFRALLAGSPAPAWWLELITPTALKQADAAGGPGGRTLAQLPPDLFLHSLDRAWRETYEAGVLRPAAAGHYAPPAINLATVGGRPRIDTLARHVRIAQWALRSVPALPGRGVPRGVTGALVLEHTPPVWGAAAEADRRLFSALLRLAGVTGAGIKTTLGLGVCATAPAEAES